MQADTPQLISYVFHEASGKCFFVSTVERDSSAAACYGSRYMQTIVWEYDWEKRQRGVMLHLTGDGPAWKQHSRIIETLYRHGVPETDEQIEEMLASVVPVPMSSEEIDNIVDHVVRGEVPKGEA